jgi:hypothetical protein
MALLLDIGDDSCTYTVFKGLDIDPALWSDVENGVRGRKRGNRRMGGQRENKVRCEVISRSRNKKQSSTSENRWHGKVWNKGSEDRTNTFGQTGVFDE